MHVQLYIQINKCYYCSKYIWPFYFSFFTCFEAVLHVLRKADHETVQVALFFSRMGYSLTVEYTVDRLSLFHGYCQIPAKTLAVPYLRKQQPAQISVEPTGHSPCSRSCGQLARFRRALQAAASQPGRHGTRTAFGWIMHDATSQCHACHGLMACCSEEKSNPRRPKNQQRWNAFEPQKNIKFPSN